jgi:hypothetical protein
LRPKTKLTSQAKDFHKSLKTESFIMNMSLPSNPIRCCDAALSETQFERQLTFAEIAALSERWEDPEKCELKPRNDPFTFVVPAFQLVVSIPRFAE